MAVEKILGPKYWHQASGLYGYTGRFGCFRLAGFGFAHLNEEAGVKRILVYPTGRTPNHYRFYMQWAPRTANQQAVAGTFAAGMAEWAELPEPEKQVYKDKAKKMKLHGVNLFMREYMYSH